MDYDLLMLIAFVVFVLAMFIIAKLGKTITGKKANFLCGVYASTPFLWVGLIYKDFMSIAMAVVIIVYITRNAENAIVSSNKKDLAENDIKIHEDERRRANEFYKKQQERELAKNASTEYKDIDGDVKAAMLSTLALGVSIAFIIFGKAHFAFKFIVGFAITIPCAFHLCLYIYNEYIKPYKQH